MAIHRDTVSDVIEDLARHAREVTDYLITNVGLTQIQVDEMGSFVKKSLCFSKCKEMLDDHLDLYQCYSNFIRIHSALTIKIPMGIRNIESTPCMAEGITKHPWTWKEFLMFKIGHEI